MAMSKCKECGKAVSTLAKICPNCGVPKPALKRKSKAKHALKKKSKAKTELNYNPKTGSFDNDTRKTKKEEYYNPKTGSFEIESKKTKTSKSKNINLKEEKQYREQRREEELRREDEEQIRRERRREENLRRKEEEQIRRQEELRRKEEEQIRRQENLRQKEEQISTTSVSSSSQNKGERDVFDEFGKGTLDLATAFWGFGILASIIVGVVCGVLAEMVHKIFNIPYVILTVIIIGDLWRCAENYKKIMNQKKQSGVWGVLTQVFCVFSGLGLAGFVINFFNQ